MCEDDYVYKKNTTWKARYDIKVYECQICTSNFKGDTFPCDEHKNVCCESCISIWVTTATSYTPDGCRCIGFKCKTIVKQDNVGDMYISCYSYINSYLR